MPGPNRLAVDELVEALPPDSKVAAVMPFIEAVRTLAEIVDSHLPGFDDKAWREYRLALRALREETSDGGSDQFDIVTELRASLGDSENANS